MVLRNRCDGRAEVPVVYVNDAEPQVAVLYVEGRLLLLEQERSGSGVHYGWPWDGSHYVWWTKGDRAMLLWHDGATSEEAAIYKACVER